MNYNSLIAQIQSYANRSEPAFVTIIPDIIKQAMSRIYSEATTIGFQKSVNVNIVTGSPNVVKPQDYKSTISFQFTIPGSTPVTQFLLERSYEFCVLYAPYPNGGGTPVFYSADLNVPQIDVAPAQFYLAPTPNNNFTGILTYLSFPPIFDANNSVNFITDRYPNLLLYACMMEAIPYLKSDERIPVFESLYKRALEAVNADTNSRYIDRFSKRNKD
jgi:hypothetical protein